MEYSKSDFILNSYAADTDDCYILPEFKKEKLP